jgi:hypothetical protein
LDREENSDGLGPLRMSVGAPFVRCFQEGPDGQQVEIEPDPELLADFMRDRQVQYEEMSTYMDSARRAVNHNIGKIFLYSLAVSLFLMAGSWMFADHSTKHHPMISYAPLIYDLGMVALYVTRMMRIAREIAKRSEDIGERRFSFNALGQMLKDYGR